jgi:hypothetical protein
MNKKRILEMARLNAKIGLKVIRGVKKRVLRWRRIAVPLFVDFDE